MPILSPNDPLIARLELSLSDWGNALPSSADAASTFVGIAAEATKDAFARTQVANWANGFQALSGSVMQQIGAPQGDISFGDDLFNGLMGLIKEDNPAKRMLDALEEIDILEEFIDKAIEYIQEFIADVLGDFLDPLIDMVGAIPIYGWIIDALWDVAMGIVQVVNFIKAQNASPEELTYAAAEFSGGADHNLASYMGKEVRTKTDWTNIFRPPSYVHDGYNPDTAFSKKLLHNGGYRLMAAGEQANWFGFIPGTTTLDLGFELRPFGVGASRSLGQLFPTTRNFGTSVWDQVNQKSPAMFAVNAVDCWNLWEDHLEDLRTYLYRHPDEHAKNFVDGFGKKLFNWANWETGKIAWKAELPRPEYHKALKISHLWPGANPELTTPARAMKTLYDRQMSYLNTTACAYVNPNPSLDTYGAFRATHDGKSPSEIDAIRDRVQKNRLLLLQHPARCTVDLSSIPDHGYRKAMEDAQKSCAEPWKGRFDGGGKGGPGADPPPVNPVPSNATLTPLDPQKLKDHVRSGGKITPLLLIGAAVGSFWYAKRKGYV